jgi:pyruvate dehydrogenase E1 component alpha subunit
MKSGTTVQSAAHATEPNGAETYASSPMEDRARRLDASLLKDLLEKMLLIRRFEEKAAELYALGKIGGFCHLYIGQEAVGVGAISTLGPDDYIFCSYREHGHALARGMDPGAVMAELCGKATGCSKGKGGSMHLFDKRLGFYGGHAIVGAHLPLATGTAFASRYLKEPRVTLCFFGDATVNIGSFHESLNLAQLWKLPVIFICENNEFGMGTPIQKTCSIENLHERACAYHMAHTAVDGMDVLAVRETVAEAAERARKENLPTLIEARTYRYMGHSMSDPTHGIYRTKVELEEHRQKDPIKRFISMLEAIGLVTQEYIDEMDSRIREVVEQAVVFADQSPEPGPQEVSADVYRP